MGVLCIVLLLRYCWFRGSCVCLCVVCVLRLFVSRVQDVIALLFYCSCVVVDFLLFVFVCVLHVYLLLQSIACYLRVICYMIAYVLVLMYCWLFYRCVVFVLPLFAYCV